MTRPDAPDDIEGFAVARAAARSERDWRRADELKGRIEAAGWRIVDDGLAYRLEPSRPPDVVVDGRTWYGSAESVPSRLGEPATATPTIIVIAAPGEPLADVLAGLEQHRPDRSHVVLVVHGPDLPASAADDVVPTAQPFGPGEALEAGLRRSIGEIVVVLAPDRVPTGDIYAPLRDALADERVAIAGVEALGSSDLRHYRPVAAGAATALGAGCYAVRRSEAATLLPIDRKLHLPGSVATWLSLELRDRGPDLAPREAVALQLPLADRAMELPEDHARPARRDAYRLADRFGDRPWLAGDEPPEGRRVGDRAGQHDDPDDRDERDHATES